MNRVGDKFSECTHCRCWWYYIGSMVLVEIMRWWMMASATIKQFCHKMCADVESRQPLLYCRCWFVWLCVALTIWHIVNILNLYDFQVFFFFDKFLIINQLVLNLMLQIFFPHFFIIIFSVVIRLINISEIDLFWNRIIFAIIRMEIRIIIFIIEFCWQHIANAIFLMCHVPIYVYEAWKRHLQRDTASVGKFFPNWNI